jgi:hypothetical protein
MITPSFLFALPEWQSTALLKQIASNEAQDCWGDNQKGRNNRSLRSRCKGQEGPPLIHSFIQNKSMHIESCLLFVKVHEKRPICLREDINKKKRNCPQSPLPWRRDSTFFWNFTNDLSNHRISEDNNLHSHHCKTVTIRSFRTLKYTILNRSSFNVLSLLVVFQRESVPTALLKQPL